jgi:hypothetical protein
MKSASDREGGFSGGGALDFLLNLLGAGAGLIHFWVADFAVAGDLLGEAEEF